MEELLPLLIGAIWLAYTWFNKGQKKKNAARSGSSAANTSQAEKEPSILEQILMGQEIRMTEPEPVYEYEEEEEDISEMGQKASAVVKENIPWSRSKIEKFTGEGSSEVKTKSPRSIYDIDDKEDEKNAVFDVEDFDLQQAVIYAEILNPPYIDYK